MTSRPLPDRSRDAAVNEPLSADTGVTEKGYLQVWNVANRVVPLGVALLSLVALAWGTYWMVRTPSPGIFQIDADPIRAAYSDHPSSSKFKLGDVVLEINGIPIVQTNDILNNHNAGETLTLTLRDTQGQVRHEDIVLTPPSPEALFNRCVLLVVATLFWLAGVVVVAVTGRAWITNRIGAKLSAFMHLIVIFVSTSLVAGVAFASVRPLQYIAAIWLGIETLRLHFEFPVPFPRQPSQRVWVGVYSLATALTLAIGLTAVAQPTFMAQHVDLFSLITSTWLVCGLLFVFAILLAGYFHSRSAEEAFQRNIIVLSNVLGFGVLTVGTLLPQVLNQPWDVAPSLTSIPLVLVPIGYAYAALRFRMIAFDGHISRVIGYLTTLTIMAGVLGLGALVLRASVPESNGPTFVLGLLLTTTVLAGTFEPTRRRIQSRVDQLFDRPYHSLRSALQSVDQAIGCAPDTSAWAQTLCHKFSTTLALRPVGLLYRQGRGFSSAAHDPGHALANLPTEIDALSPLLARLATWTGPGFATELRAAFERSTLPEAERAWLFSSDIEIWWPIHSHGTLQAVLVLGRKNAGLAPEEVEMVSLASNQIGTALENAQFARELEQLSRAALQARDEERHRVARELHDHIIQPLVGINFALSGAREVPAAAEARGQITDLITHVRRISADLRPPALDEVGLPAAARGLARTVARQTGIMIDMALVPDEDLIVPEPLASTFYSALREALANIRQHAQASRVSVLLEGQPGWLTLVVHDDGVGFTPPTRLGLLAPTGHFGLLGLQERMSAVGGTLHLHTEPGSGTRLEFRAPVPYTNPK